MVIKTLEKQMKDLVSMNEYRMKAWKEDEIEIISLKEAIAELISKGVK